MIALFRPKRYSESTRRGGEQLEFARAPARAESFADKLGGFAQRASHLVHMPSHTYYWVGRYQDAATVSHRAVELGKENALRLGLNYTMPLRV
jgi:hypothetical protein